MNTLRQLVDLKNRKIKSKYTDSSCFYQILTKEQQRTSTETFYLNKTSYIRIEDKAMVK